MGGTQRNTPSQPSANPKRARVWSDSDHIELLAWLEHCSRHGIDFMNTSIEYLKHSTGKEFSSRQIWDKLKREWQKFGNCDQFEDVFTTGISAFSPLEEHKQTKVVERVKHLDQQSCQDGTTSHEILAPASDSSTLSDISSQPDIEESCFSFVPGQPHRSIYSVPSKEPKEEPRFASATTSTESICKDTAQPKGKARGGPGKGKGPLRSSPATYGTQSPIPLSPTNPVGDPTRLSILEDQLAEKDNIIAAKEQALMSQNSFILSLQARMFHMQNEIKALGDCRRAAEDHHSNTNMQEQLRRQISTLKQQLKDKTQLEKDLEAIQTSQLGISFPEVVQRFNSIQGFIEDACASVEPIDMPDLASKLGHDKFWSGTTELWAETGSGLTIPNLIQHCLDMEISSLRLTRLLAASALCHLVFEAVFPAILTIDSPLIDQYRRQILNKFGHRELYIVDSLAHKGLVLDGFFKTSTFKEMIARLQRTFSHHLQWLLSSQHYVSNGTGSDSQDHGDAPPSVADAFKQTLKASLKLKVELMVPDVYYLLHFFKPGDLFDAASMNYDGTVFADAASKRQRKTTGRSEQHTSKEIVSLCIFPAIYASPRGIRAQNLGEGLSIEACVVDYTNFLNGTVSSGPQSWTLISKATVLVYQEGNGSYSQRA